ncbi:MAG TPA: hypothetical protein VJ698_13715 [Noviherbaspirillum sp.]|uniref:hypothetical protein n=1 Tax=Noviherbaspirillum sp. TaxID=1926288 RepID=UPI002B4A4850|nr:hypothetical protein [Noviherbaspirillum sp.]HJV86525.1 hypothetical protein [Noviherbaspirillum sp.]
MSDLQRDPIEAERPDPRMARTKDNPLGVDDIGLPADIVAENMPELDEIRPDPEKLGKSSCPSPQDEQRKI